MTTQTSQDTNTKRKYSYDLHGVIDTFTEVFKKDMFDKIKEGHTVLVISGPPKIQVISELSALGLVKNTHYHDVLSVVDFIKSMGHPMWKNPDGSMQTSEEVWWGVKGTICFIEDVHEHIDNDIRYMPAFIHERYTTTFKLLNGA